MVELQRTQEQVSDLERRLSQMPSQEDFDEISAKLRDKEDELSSERRLMMDMRNALTIEVADKHDIILNLRRDVQQLEEQCRQSNKQTLFKDDIIKELRKEIKQLKAEVSPNEVLEPSQNLHESYPHIRNLHALDLKINSYSLHSKKLDHGNIKRKCVTTDNSPTKQENKPFIFIHEEDCIGSPTTQIQENSQLIPDKEKPVLNLVAHPHPTFTQTKQVNQKATRHNKSVNSAPSEVPVVVGVPSDLLRLINNQSYYKQKHKLLPGVNFENYKSFTHRKPRCKLTAKTILHEYYGIQEQVNKYGFVENFKENPKKSVVSVPNHVPVKTFVTNLEQNAKKQTESETKTLIKKTVSSDYNYLKHSDTV